MTVKEKISRRKDDNAFIREVIKLHQAIFPDLRYIQSLWALKIIDNNDRFNEEPYDTIVRILPEIKLLLAIAYEMPSSKSVEIKILESNVKNLLLKFDNPSKTYKCYNLESINNCDLIPENVKDECNNKFEKFCYFSWEYGTKIGKLIGIEIDTTLNSLSYILKDNYSGDKYYVNCELSTINLL